MKTKTGALQLDPNMALKPVDSDGLRFSLPAAAPMRLAGLAWYGEEFQYRRLRRTPPSPFPEAVDLLAWNTAGAQCAWRSDSGRVTVRVRLRDNAPMYHMPQTGEAGFDLYCGAPGLQSFVGVAQFQSGVLEYEAQLFAGTREMREYTLNFPLYAGVESVFIGLDADARIEAPTPWEHPEPVVFYGTSITQGGCASRPGMAHTNILSRKLRRPVLNFGFSGNGRGDASVAAELADLKDPALYVLEYEANLPDPEQMRRTLSEFLRILRSLHPATPILVCSRPPFAGDFRATTAGKTPELQPAGRAMMNTVARWRAEDPRLFFFDGGELFGAEDPDECTVDGVHPTDLGFSRIAGTLEPVLRGILASDRSA